MSGVIGFDPATVTGYAYRDSHGEWVTGVTNVKDKAALALLLSWAKAAGVTTTYIEDCYYQNNPRTLKVLQDIQTRIVVACEAADIQTHIIMPSEWQSSYRINGTRTDRKRGARAIARILCGGDTEPKSQDECDAVCIADYGERKERSI